jgi:hypothetical protein
MMNTGGHNMEMTMEDIMAEDIRLYEAAAMPDRAAGDCGHTYAEREADFNRWRRRHDTMVMTDVIALAFGLDAGDRERLRARLDGIDVYSDEDVMWVLMNHMRPRTTPATERTDADPLDGHGGMPMASPAVDADDGGTAYEPASTSAHVPQDPTVPAYERLP